ncbi:hypothetical protein [Streptomyces sp. NPDC056921]|uniref:hypothetical protein n=1 Tax=Streptomyces sp. NPDC056921 TaxID=3345966 RepID=UPI003629EB09
MIAAARSGKALIAVATRAAASGPTVSNKTVFGGSSGWDRVLGVAWVAPDRLADR